MQRDCKFEEISDGRKYKIQDMVRADCHDCKGCSACCHGMGSSIVLDPFDIYQLTTGLDTTMENLLAKHLELNVVEGVILPNLKMDADTDGCAFLTEEGRCSIHKLRPGICRLFPLGRIYEDGDFSYFLQVHECKNKHRTKIKVSKWIGVENIKENQKFINDWHYYIKESGEKLVQSGDERALKAWNMKMLQTFFLLPYDKNRDFYSQYYERRERFSIS